MPESDNGTDTYPRVENGRLVFDMSVFDGLWDGVESVLPERPVSCIFHVFIPPEIMAALRAQYMRVIGQGRGEIDHGVTLGTFEKSAG